MTAGLRLVGETSATGAEKPVMDELEYRPIRVATGSEDERGLLVLHRGRLVGVLVRLDAEMHGDQRGMWNLEVGFGPCDGHPAPFPTLADHARWLSPRLAAEGGGGALEG